MGSVNNVHASRAETWSLQDASTDSGQLTSHVLAYNLYTQALPFWISSMAGPEGASVGLASRMNVCSAEGLLGM